MTDTSDTQTNLKTQPLYFTPWEDVLEGQEVWVFDSVNNKYTARHKKMQGRLFYTFDMDCGSWEPSSCVLSKCKFLPAPQDRPKPNIWDEYMGMGGDYLDSPIDDTCSGSTHKVEIIENKEFYRAKAAWINHVLDGE